MLAHGGAHRSVRIRGSYRDNWRLHIESTFGHVRLDKRTPALVRSAARPLADLPRSRTAPGRSTRAALVGDRPRRRHCPRRRFTQAPTHERAVPIRPPARAPRRGQAQDRRLGCTVAVPAPVVGLWREHLTAQRRARIAAPFWVDPDLVFTTSIGTAIEPRNINRDWTAVCTRAGISTRACSRPPPHDGVAHAAPGSRRQGGPTGAPAHPARDHGGHLHDRAGGRSACGCRPDWRLAD